MTEHNDTLTADADRLTELFYEVEAMIRNEGGIPGVVPSVTFAAYGLRYGLAWFEGAVKGNLGFRQLDTSIHSLQMPLHTASLPIRIAAAAVLPQFHRAVTSARAKIMVDARKAADDLDAWLEDYRANPE